MTPLQALELLEKATAHLTTNRETHIQIMEACKIIGAALMAASEKPPAADLKD